MTTINQLSTIDTLQGADLVPVYSSSNGDARKASMTTVKNFVSDALQTQFEQIQSEIDALESNIGAGDASLVGYQAAGAGSVLRNVGIKLNEYVSVEDFGAVGDGVTDDTLAMTNFFNSAIARPGVLHFLPKKTYAISAVMPTINVSNVCIYGCGAEIHDVGPLVTGTVLKWIGTPGTAGPLVRITSISGATNQRVSHVTFSGIGIDCGTGAINYGIELNSVFSCTIDVVVANAALASMQIGVVASLGEAKDTQRCKIYLKARQIEAPNGFGLVTNGDASANTSLNEFWCDIQHANAAAIYSSNSDNNDWRYVRTLKVPSGTATECVSLLGGPTDPERVRTERFHFLTCNVPLHAYGTGSYAFGSVNSKIYCLDTQNGSPSPIIDPGASVLWQKDTSALADTAWVDYTPSLSAISGSITSGTASGRYAKRGKVVTVNIRVSITTNGTGGGALGVSLPISSSGSIGARFYGKERALTGKAVAGYADSTTAFFQFYDGSYPGSDGCLLELGGTYEVD